MSRVHYIKTSEKDKQLDRNMHKTSEHPSDAEEIQWFVNEKVLVLKIFIWACKEIIIYFFILIVAQILKCGNSKNIDGNIRMLF